MEHALSPVPARETATKAPKSVAIIGFASNDAEMLSPLLQLGFEIVRMESADALQAGVVAILVSGNRAGYLNTILDIRAKCKHAFIVVITKWGCPLG